MSLDGKVAVVTGAATGIGAALAQGLASAGAKVVGIDIRVANHTDALFRLVRPFFLPPE